MSTIYPVQVPCQHCGQRYEAEIADSLNVERLAACREWVLSRSLHRSTCPHCQTTQRHEKPLFYADFPRGLFVQMFPQAERVQYPQMEELVLEMHDKAFSPPAPPIAQAIGQQTTPRLVFGYEELREKVLLADAGVDDSLVEILKINVLTELMHLVRDGVVALTVQAVIDTDDGRALRLEAHRVPGEGPRVDVEPGERIETLDVKTSALEELAAQRERLERQLPQLFHGVWVNMLRYRFDPRNAGMSQSDR